MTALWILLAALLVVLLAGLGCFALACARRPQPDMADPAPCRPRSVRLRQVRAAAAPRGSSAGPGIQMFSTLCQAAPLPPAVI